VRGAVNARPGCTGGVTRTASYIISSRGHGLKAEENMTDREEIMMIEAIVEPKEGCVLLYCTVRVIVRFNIMQLQVLNGSQSCAQPSVHTQVVT